MNTADEDALRELSLSLVRDGRPIEAVQFVRGEVGCSLRAAGLIVRGWADASALPLPDLTVFKI